MAACAYGASVNAGEPTYYTVSDADIDAWFPLTNFLFRLWLGQYVGRTFRLSDLALANPDVPPARAWSDLLTTALTGSRFTPVGVVNADFDSLIAYLVFRDHCTCNLAPCAGGGSYTFAGCCTNNINSPAVGPVVAGTHVVASGTLKYNSGGSNNGGAVYVAAWNDALHTSFVGQSNRYSFASGPVGTQPWSFPSFDVSAWAGKYIDVGFGVSVNGSSYDFTANWDVICPSGGTTPTVAGAVSTTGLQTVAAPSGTTSDQIMRELLVQQTELRAVQDMLIAQQGFAGGRILTPGTVHAALAGDGEFATVGLAGVRVQVTTMPTYVDRWIDHPDVYSGAGRISFSNGSGWSESAEVSHLDSIILAPFGGAGTVGYHFGGGVVATITELPA